jgi:hypothetical protein
MQAVEIRIPGHFWDCFLYDGQLYLFTLEGDIQLYDWDRLVETISVEDDCRPLLWQFATRGQAWYAPEMQKILESPKILGEVKSLAEKIASGPLEVSSKILRKDVIETAASPAHPHTDVEAFYRTLYLASSSGVRAATMSRKMSNNFKTLSDIPALRVACSYGSMAVAAGSEGMYEQVLTSLRDWPRRNKPRRLSGRNCVSCSWASFDVVGTAGPGDAGFVAAFSKPQSDEMAASLNITGTYRELLDIVESNDLFPSSDGLLFGADNLLVMTSRSSLYVDGWNPRLRRDDRGVDVQRSLFSRNEVEMQGLTDDAIDGTATAFGIAVEMDSALLLRGVDGSITSFGEPVNWRTYPRSRRYLNHLHVTYDDYVAVFAFFEDYFISPSNRGPAISRPQVRGSGRSGL